MKKLILAFLFVLFGFVFASSTQAIENPLAVSNNRFGIHITDLSDLKDAAKLVNSSGGDWGYVTFVIQKTDRNTSFWQSIFDQCRRLHLIPIVRIATRPQGDVWEKPSLGDIDGWVTFFNSLNWVVQNRYVVIGNEPNHAKEWGGEVNPEEYTEYLIAFSSKLRNSSNDFFVLPAGLDSSAPNGKGTMDEYFFLKRMYVKNNSFLTYLDGWTSHSYPNPAFSGSPGDTGRTSIRNFYWEESVLKDFGLNKKLPVFITETGWMHKVKSTDRKLFSTDELGSKYVDAFANAWSDPNIVTVTPFVLSYKEPPFDYFSWRAPDNSFFPFYSAVEGISKKTGTPIQSDKAEIMSFYVFPYQLLSSNYNGVFLVKNTGQAIWNRREFSLHSKNEVAPTITSVSFENLEPGEVGLISFSGISSSEADSKAQSVILFRMNTPISQEYFFHIITISPQKMKLEALWSKIIEYFRLN
jgi:hypothetical protein